MADCPEIRPCPFCGAVSPFTYISVFCVVVECECGATMRQNSATVLYKVGELPPELEPWAYDAKLLVMRAEDGTETGWPDHGYRGVNALAALDHAGVLGKWNQRAEDRDDG